MPTAVKKARSNNGAPPASAVGGAEAAEETEDCAHQGPSPPSESGGGEAEGASQTGEKRKARKEPEQGNVQNHKLEDRADRGEETVKQGDDDGDGFHLCPPAEAGGREEPSASQVLIEATEKPRGNAIATETTGDAGKDAPERPRPPGGFKAAGCAVGYTRVYAPGLDATPGTVAAVANASALVAAKRKSVVAAAVRAKSSFAHAKQSDAWKDHYDQLAKYREHHGTASVEPVVNPKADPQRHCLYWWADVQRKLQSMSLLEEDRVKLLDSLGFEWTPAPKRNPDDANLKREKAETKRFLFELQMKTDEVVRAKGTRKRKRDTIAKEESPKRVPPPRFMSRFNFLKEWALKNGHCYVQRPLSFESDPELSRTYTWIYHVQRQHSKGTLREERRKLLESLPGFSWSAEIRKRNAEYTSFHGERVGATDDPSEEECEKKRTRRERAGSKKEPSEEEKERFRARLREATKLDPLERMPPPIWLERYEQLTRFGELFGHLQVPRPPHGTSADRQAKTKQMDPDFAKLFSWQKSVRRQYRRGTLRDERIQLLERIGWVWSEKETETRLEALSTNQRKASIVDTPANRIKKKPATSELAERVVKAQSRKGQKKPLVSEVRQDKRQRKRRKTGLQQGQRQKKQLDAERDRVQDNEKEGGESDKGKGYMPPTRWMVRYEQLKHYHEEHGDFSVLPSSDKAADASDAGGNPEMGRLYKWVRAQRKQLVEGSLREKQRELLEDIGFDSPRKSGRRKKKSVTEENSAQQEEKEESDGSSEDKRKGKQPPPPTDALAEDPSDITKKPYVPPPPFVERFEQLRKYREEHGHFCVTRPLSIDTGADYQISKLHEWVRSTRKRDARGTLLEEHKQLLLNIGFEFAKPSLVVAPWARMIQQLKNYKEKNGNLQVRCTSEDKKENTDLYRLYSWVVRIRKKIRAGKVAEERMKQLEGLGFSWAYIRPRHPPIEWDYDSMFQRLVEYASLTRDCSIPTALSRESDPELHELLRFVIAQRAHYKNGTLSDERRDELASLGIDWTPGKTRSEERWNSHFRRLELFKLEKGHCRVPDKWPEDKPLAGFVSRMRYLWRVEEEGRLQKKDRNVLTPERKARLLELGFEVSINPTRGKKSWDDRYDQLQEYFGDHGHCDLPCRYNKILLLPRWVKEQRKQYKLLFNPQEGKTSTLTMEQHRKLEDLGFDFTGDRVPRERCQKRWHYCTCDFDYGGGGAAEEEQS